MALRTQKQWWESSWKHYVRPVWPTVDGEPQMSMHLDIAEDDLDEAVAYAVEVGAKLAS